MSQRRSPRTASGGSDSTSPCKLGADRGHPSSTLSVAGRREVDQGIGRGGAGPACPAVPNPAVLVMVDPFREWPPMAPRLPTFRREPLNCIPQGAQGAHKCGVVVLSNLSALKGFAGRHGWSTAVGGIALSELPLRNRLEPLPIPGRAVGRWRCRPRGGQLARHFGAVGDLPREDLHAARDADRPSCGPSSRSWPATATRARRRILLAAPCRP